MFVNFQRRAVHNVNFTWYIISANLGVLKPLLDLALWIGRKQCNLASYFPCVITCDLWQQPVNVCFLETWRRKVWPPFKWTFRPISPRCILLLYFPLRCTFFLSPPTSVHCSPTHFLRRSNAFEMCSGATPCWRGLEFWTGTPVCQQIRTICAWW